MISHWIATFMVAAAFVAPSVQQHRDHDPAMMGEHCPMKGGQVDVRVEDTDAGVALLFNAGEGELEALRSHVARAANMLEQHRDKDGHADSEAHAHGGDADRKDHPDHGERPHRRDRPATPQASKMAHPRLPALGRISTEETADGIRMDLEPAAGDDLVDLRRQVRQMVDRMSKGECMMMRMMERMPGGEAGERSPGGR